MTGQLVFALTVAEQHAAGDHLNCDVAECVAAAWRRGQVRL